MIHRDAIPQSGGDHLVRVFLTCIACGKTEEINVRRERQLPRKIYWECLACQKQMGRTGKKSIT